MDQEIIVGLKQRITREGLDAIISISPGNVTYISGFIVASQALIRRRHAITVDRRNRWSWFDMESTMSKAHAGIDDLHRCLQQFANEERNQEAGGKEREKGKE